MKIVKTNENVLFTNDLGEYHLSHDDFNKMGEKAAVKLATEEIEKKSKIKTYVNKTIDFEQARELGFCRYGIEDFCKKLNIDKSNTYEISDLLGKLNVDAFLSYTNECVKLFGKNSIMNNFGGVKKFLEENPTRRALNFVFHNNFVSDKELHLLACDFAERTLPIFEEKYPTDKRPRNAIRVKRLWIEEEYSKEL